MPRRTALLLVGLVLTLGLPAAPAAASLPDWSGSVTFSGGPPAFPNPGTSTSTTCEADSSPCSVSLTTTSVDGFGAATGTVTITDGSEILTIPWGSTEVTGGLGVPRGELIVGQGTDQHGYSYQLDGVVSGAANGTQGQLAFYPLGLVCDPSRPGPDPVCSAYNSVNGPLSDEVVASGAIAKYETEGTASGNSFSTSTFSCTSPQPCSLSLSGTGSVPSTTINPISYTASGTGTVVYGRTSLNFTFEMTTEMCDADQTCGEITGTGTDSTGAQIDLKGEVTVKGFGQTNPFPLLTGSLAFTRIPPS